MSKLEEMVETFITTIDGAFCPDDFRRGLLAVFEKHVKAMVAEAYDDALFEHTEMDRDARDEPARTYATRIIEELRKT